MQFFVAGVAQLVRAPGCGPGGRGFNSRHSPHITSGLLRRTQAFAEDRCFNMYVAVCRIRLGGHLPHAIGRAGWRWCG